MQTHYHQFMLRALTSLHPGTGRSEFSAIDHQVQRDWRGFPTIFKSSLKGALNEYFKAKKQEGLGQIAFGGNHSISNMLLDTLRYLKNRADLQLDPNTIGTLEEELNKQVQGVFRAGKVSVHDAELLSIPVRSNFQPFFHATCPQILKDWKERSEFFLGKERANPIIDTVNYLDKFGLLEASKNRILDLRSNKTAEKVTGEVYLERFEFTATFYQPEDTSKLALLKSMFGNFLALVRSEAVSPGEDAPFSILVDDFHLPIIPRNQLENGKSNQLWYEQVLHPETRFYTFFGFYDESDQHRKSFLQQVHDQVINVGANLSVGYGRCHFQRMDSVTTKSASHG